MILARLALVFIGALAGCVTVDPIQVMIDRQQALLAELPSDLRIESPAPSVPFTQLLRFGIELGNETQGGSRPEPAVDTQGESELTTGVYRESAAGAGVENLEQIRQILRSSQIHENRPFDFQQFELIQEILPTIRTLLDEERRAALLGSDAARAVEAVRLELALGYLLGRGLTFIEGLKGAELQEEALIDYLRAHLRLEGLKFTDRGAAEKALLDDLLIFRPRFEDYRRWLLGELGTVFISDLLNHAETRLYAQLELLRDHPSPYDPAASARAAGNLAAEFLARGPDGLNTEFPHTTGFETVQLFVQGDQVEVPESKPTDSELTNSLLKIDNPWGLVLVERWVAVQEYFRQSFATYEQRYACWVLATAARVYEHEFGELPEDLATLTESHILPRHLSLDWAHFHIDYDRAARRLTAPMLPESPVRTLTIW